MEGALYALILGSLVVMMALFLFGCSIYIMKKGRRVTGTICGIKNPSIVCCSSHCAIEVQFHKDEQDVKLATMNNFHLLPLFEKYQVARLRKKHIGKQVHIYYNPDKILQVLIREYMWKDFLLYAILLAMGIFVIFVGIYVMMTGTS